MEREVTLRQIVNECAQLAPAFRKYFMTSDGDDAGHMTAQERLAIIVLASEHKSIPMNRLSSALGISKQQTTRLADGLADRGYIVRSVNPDNRREVLVRLDERGRKAFDDVLSRKISYMNDLTARCSDGQMEELLRHVRAVRELMAAPL